MAGSDPGFDATEFREAVRFAMQMGAPSDPSLRATFRWSEQETFDTDDVVDPGGTPYNWNTTPVSETTPDDVQIDVAVQFSGEQGITGTGVGPFSRARAVITVLDEDYPSIIGADEVILGGDVYDIIASPMPEGLFEVTVWTIIAAARSAA